MDKYPLVLDPNTIELLDSIFGHLPISMVLTDAQGRIVMLNNHYAEFLNVRKIDLIGRPVEEVVPNSRIPVVLATGKPEISRQHVYSNGVKSIVHRIPVFTEGGQVAGCLGLVLFESMEELQHLARVNEVLYTKLSAYQNEIKSLFRAKYGFDDILGQSVLIRKNKELAKRMARSKSNVLITGESGTGKELWAHAIHLESERAEFPFVSVNCGAIPENLLETELFGYEEGAFTGAKKGGKLGKFHLANGGTLFLDEIGDMPLVMQVKILRVLQEREVEKVGGKGVENINVRIIAATNRDLEQMIHKGTFREDLFYRLNVLSFHLPALREHPEDIGLLVQHFVTNHCISSGVTKRFTQQTLEIFSKYSWPGNIRELNAVVERLLVSAECAEISPVDLPRNMCINFEKKERDCDGLDQALADVEKDMIIKALSLSKNSKAEASKLLGIPRSRLYRKIEQYKIETQEGME
jgi:transcriptional regulator with PAS, ATPase and Fis domain